MSTTTAVPPSSLRSWLTGCLLAILAFGACWTGAIFYWRARDGDPGTGELLLYLFLLPGALLAAALVARKRLAAPRAGLPHQTRTRTSHRNAPANTILSLHPRRPSSVRVLRRLARGRRPLPGSDRDTTRRRPRNDPHPPT